MTHAQCSLRTADVAYSPI